MAHSGQRHFKAARQGGHTLGTGTSCPWAKAAPPPAAPGSINKFCHLLSEHRLRLGHSAPGPTP